jgi:hypothetical protein
MVDGWPLSASMTAEEIREVVSLFPLDPGIETDLATETSVGATVMSVESQHRVAKTYGLLSGRKPIIVPDDDLIARMEDHRPSVIIVPLDQVSLRLLDRITDPDLPWPTPGLITAPAEHVMKRSVAAALALRLPIPSVIGDVRLVPDGSGGVRRGALTFDAQSPAEERRQALALGADLLSIITHSDGVDADLGADLILCGALAASSSADLASAPRCVITGRCHRQSVAAADVRRGLYPAPATLPTVAQAMASGHLLLPGEISARLLVFHVCWGLLPPTPALDNRWGTIAGILAEGAVGSIITTWQAEVTDTGDALRLVDRLASGVSLREAVRSYNSDPGARARGNRLCILGDPLTRIARPGGARPSGGRPPRRAAATHADFVSAYLELATAKLAGPLHELGLETKALYDLHLAEQDPAAGDRARKAVVDFVCRRGPLISQDWLEIGRILPATTKESHCPVCAAPARMIQVEVSGVARCRRTIMNCPRCSIASDMPAGFPFGAIRIDTATMALAGPPPEAGWEAAILLDPILHSERRYCWWPRRADGMPEESFEMPGAWPAGHVFVATVLMVGNELAVFGHIDRRPEPAD